MIREIIFRVTDSNYGWPDPYVEDGSLLIKVSSNRLYCVKYTEANDECPFPMFEEVEHDINAFENEILNALADSKNEDADKFFEFKND